MNPKRVCFKTVRRTGDQNWDRWTVSPRCRVFLCLFLLYNQLSSSKHNYGPFSRKWLIPMIPVSETPIQLCTSQGPRTIEDMNLRNDAQCSPRPAMAVCCHKFFWKGQWSMLSQYWVNIIIYLFIILCDHWCDKTQDERWTIFLVGRHGQCKRLNPPIENQRTDSKHFQSVRTKSPGHLSTNSDCTTGAPVTPVTC